MRQDDSQLYDLTEDLLNTYTPVIETFLAMLKEELRKPVSTKIDSLYLDFTNTEMNPYRVACLLRDIFGFIEIGMYRNGWNNKYWWYFRKENGPTLCLYGTSIIGTCRLRYEYNNWDNLKD